MQRSSAAASSSTASSANGSSTGRKAAVKKKIGRRRGAASSSSAKGSASIHQPLYSGIKLLLALAVTLTFGMVLLFAYHGPTTGGSSSSNSIDPRTARIREKLAGIPHNVRGNVAKVAVPKKDGNKIGGGAGGGGGAVDAEADEADDDDRKGGDMDDDDVKKRIREKRRKESEERHRQQQQHPELRGARPDAYYKKEPPALDLGTYDGTPTKPYPYSLEPAPSSLTLEQLADQWTPPGGSRFSEYTTGGTPYLIDDATKRKSDAQARSRREYVKETMQHAWNGYATYAYGSDEIKPQTKKGGDNWGGQGITLVDSLDTLWLMGLKDEFWKARDWVRDHLSHEHAGSVSVFETTIRDLGGLLAAYDWSSDKVFLTKAEDLGRRLLKAFDGSPTGLPSGMVDMSTGHTKNLGWAGGNIIVAEAGTLQVENRYLSKMTGKPEFAATTEKVYDVLKDISPENGLFPYFLRNRGDKPTFANDKLTFGAMGDSLYEYMLKIWIQGGKTESKYREMYDLAIDSMHKELLQKSTPSELRYIADEGRQSGSIDHKMDHLVCFMGGLLALGAYTDPQGLESERAQRDLRTGKALTYTCYQMYARMNTGISPEFVQFMPGQDLQVGRGAPHYLLRPEAFESFFILNQLTDDPVYREWGWEAYLSIEKYCKTDVAYGALSNVQDTSGRPRDSMESFFLAETLKYLYLLQDPDTEVDVLNKHVFNTEAHPLRTFPVIDASAGDGPAAAAVAR